MASLTKDAVVVCPLRSILFTSTDFLKKYIKVFFSYKATLAWPRFKFKSVDVFLNRVRSSANIICPVDHIANGERGRDREQREKDEEKALHFLKPRRG